MTEEIIVLMEILKLILIPALLLRKELKVSYNLACCNGSGFIIKAVVVSMITSITQEDTRKRLMCLSR